MAKFRIEQQGDKWFASVCTDGKTFKYLCRDGTVAVTDWPSLIELPNRLSAAKAIGSYKELQLPPPPMVIVAEWEDNDA